MNIFYGGESLDVKISERFTPTIKLGYYFLELDSHKYVPIDRGFKSDYYSTNIVIHGTKEEVDSFLLFVENARSQLVRTFFLDLTSEPIFGENVDYSQFIEASISEIGKRINVAKDVYEVNVTFVAVTDSLTFNTYTGEPFTALCVEYGTEEYTENGTKFLTAYNTSEHFITDDFNDISFFTGTFSVNDTQMGNIRNFYRNVRGDSFVLTQDMLSGVQYPFGPSQGGYPFNVKIIELKEVYISCNRYSVNITLVKDK